MLDESIIRLTVTEAAKLFGLSTKTIRLAIKNNEIRYIVVRGRYKINFKSLLLWSQKSIRRHKRLNKYGFGQFVDKWKMNNKKYSPSTELIK